MPFDDGILMMCANATVGEVLVGFVTGSFESLFLEATIVCMVRFDVDTECVAMPFEGKFGSDCLFSVGGGLTVDEVFSGVLVDEDGSTVEFGIHEFAFELGNESRSRDFKLVDGDSRAWLGVGAADGRWSCASSP